MDKTYTIIPDFILDFDLNLSEVVALSVIYGFSQDGESEFSGSYAYLARKCKCSRQWAIGIVSSLIKKGYVTKTVDTVKGVKKIRLRTEIGSQESLLVKKIDQSTLSSKVVKKVDKGSQESLPNNISDNIIDNINNPTARTRERIDNGFLTVSSMEREALGFSPEKIVDAKRGKLRVAAIRLAGSGDDRWAMTAKQIDRFVAYWGERLRGTDKIRAENDEYFCLPDKMERWVAGDNERGKRERNVEPIDARPISERMTINRK